MGPGAPLQKELREVMSLPEVRERLLAQGQTPIGNTPEEAQAAQSADVAKWGALIKGFGIRID